MTALAPGKCAVDCNATVGVKSDGSGIDIANVKSLMRNRCAE